MLGDPDIVGFMDGQLLGCIDNDGVSLGSLEGVILGIATGSKDMDGPLLGI